MPGIFNPFAGGTATHNRSEFRFGASQFSVPPGVTYECFGPWALPLETGSLHGFQPEVDLSIVHHMILYGGSSRNKCNGFDIVYAWARTGQQTPIGLDFATDPAAKANMGFNVGAHGIRYVSLQIHYQRPRGAPVLHGDQSGIRLTISPALPRTPLHVQLNMLIPQIPPRTIVDLCTRCSVRMGGTVFAFRNHAHRLGRDIWSDHWRRGAVLPPLGLIDSQQPQIVRMLKEPRRLEAGDVLQLHCVYNSTLRTTPTGFDIDEEKGEMCNQYLFATPSLLVSCGKGCDKRS